MKKALYKAWAAFLTAFGNVRISKFFPWLYYDSTDFAVDGRRIRGVEALLEPGDVVLRGYSSYLDGRFIDDPLGFSHGAVYVGGGEIVHAVAEGVSRISVIDFCRCDRIAVFRPRRGRAKAVKAALRYLREDTPYDFLFRNGSSALYCFELCALCYPGTDLRTVPVRKLLFLKKDVYLAKSFFDSKDFRCVCQYNPRFNIDFGWEA